MSYSGNFFNETLMDSHPNIYEVTNLIVDQWGPEDLSLGSEPAWKRTIKY